MDPAALKARFGDRMAFWGGAIDAQHVLPSASPETVREHVRRNLEVWKPGGGYVFNNVHNIQAGVPPENVVALFDAAYEFGFYEYKCAARTCSGQCAACHWLRQCCVEGSTGKASATQRHPTALSWRQRSATHGRQPLVDATLVQIGHEGLPLGSLRGGHAVHHLQAAHRPCISTHVARFRPGRQSLPRRDHRIGLPGHAPLPSLFAISPFP